MHTSTISNQTVQRTLAHYDGTGPGEYLSDSDSYNDNDNDSDCGSDNYNNYEFNYESNNKEASCASTSTTEVVKERKGILSSPSRDMSNDKGSLDCLLIYSFLFPNEKGSSLYNAYDRSEVEDKLVIKIDQDDDHAPKFSVANNISEVYGLPGIYECINGQKPLRAVIDIDASQKDMETTGVKAQEVFFRICLSFIRALYRILDCGWEDILNGLVIATSSDPSKCSYHILYAPAFLIDHCELKAFTELVYTITGEKFGKYIDRILPGQNFNLRLIGSAKKSCVKRLEVRPRMLSTEKNNNSLRISVGLDILQKYAELVLQKHSSYLRDWIIEKKDSENFVPGFPKAFVNFPSWTKYNESLSATETYEERYVRPLLNEGDIYVGSPWETGKTYVLEHLTIFDDMNLLVLSTHHSYSNAVTTRLNLKSYCDIDVSIIAQAQSRLAGQSIEKLYKLIQKARHIIVMDNDLTDLNIEWIKALRKNISFSIIHNTYQPQKGKTFHLAPNKETVLAELWDWARQISSLPFENQKSASLICHLRKDV
ncbi:hypothetical protein C1646_775099 [Rhizophagus diaphanus]|nr:hypothetical protein C1646_775099 [Rhizophagus diaphanus] [Rhizophagus sp. MUCL 43196]